MSSEAVYLSTAYLGPIQYYCKLYAYGSAMIEACEHYPKQTYRNRCIIAGANGPLSLSVPVEKSAEAKMLTRDVRISDHGNWRRMHRQALISAYNMSPFFEYYADDFAAIYDRPFGFLIDFNDALCRLACSLLDLNPKLSRTTSYAEEVPNDCRNIIRPRHPQQDEAFRPVPYYQVFASRHGFLPNLSIADLLFNLGPEGLIVLRDSCCETNA
ncbi:MAG: WbqC family protein [Tannerellaceae bacterium]|jgi:hypothetical protein|nr:WbqC family protein [Tannerellaceae bacterium]